MRELQFLTNLSLQSDSIYSSVYSGSYSPEQNISAKEGQIKKIKHNSFLEKNNENENKETNPFTFILDELSKTSCTRIDSRHIAYLKDLGVKPINRMFVLRRFGGINSPVPYGPPVDLNDSYKRTPDSVIVGFMEEEDDLLGGMSFNEVWRVQKDYIHTLIGNIMRDEFGIQADKIASVPGFSQGLLVSMLQGLGITDSARIRDLFGNPNLNDQGAVRDGGGSKSEFTLKSSWNFNLKVVYEAKYINDIDPVDSMKYLINNLLRMGSQNEQLFPLGDKGRQIAEFIGSNPEEAWKEIKKLITGFIENISETFGIDLDKEKEKQQQNRRGKRQTRREKRRENKERQSQEEQERQRQEELEESGTDKLASGILGLNEGLDMLEKLAGAAGAIGENIWHATIGKYRYPVSGVLGTHNGNSTTPWHLTIGNPLCPILSMNHIVVSDVKLSAKAADGITFTDIPKTIEATITVKNSRDLGTNRLSPMFFRNNRRFYKSPPEPQKTQEVSQNIVNINDPMNLNWSGEFVNSSSDYLYNNDPYLNNSTKDSTGNQYGGAF